MALDAPGFYAQRLPELESRLPVTANGDPYEVYVTKNINANFVTIGCPKIFLSIPVASLLMNGTPSSIDETYQMAWPYAAFILYHEWWHLAFSEENEVNTDLGAIAIYREMLRKYWHLSPVQAQHMYEAMAGTPGVPGKLRGSYWPEYTPNAWDTILGGEPPAVPGPGPDPFPSADPAPRARPNAGWTLLRRNR